ncbi:DUF402 domain-containing protein [Marinitoga lauensis]|uniref:DUF402 domain-containing protein n=1 Tax=Marinitoga lauensis TaxID=2201189 RepID=UPI0014044C2C|nr:DUF402 domain-containing protein [Marinitoga lauensis]
MKHYKFDLDKKNEYLISPSREVKASINNIYKFNNSFGIERNWKHLDKHNSIKKIKRLIIPEHVIMLTSFLTETNSHLKNYLIYIDFGKYLKNGNTIEFEDLELDIIIKRDSSFEVDDMDELIDEFEKNHIDKRDFYRILLESIKIINNFEEIGPVKYLKKELGKDVIDWLINLG